MTTCYAQINNADWSTTHQWNTAANGSGSWHTPAAGDTCDLNGKTVGVDSSFNTPLGGTITVVDTPGTGLLLFNVDITNTDTWICSCNVQVTGDGSNGYLLTLTDLTVNAVSNSLCHLTIGDSALDTTYLVILGHFGLGGTIFHTLYVHIGLNAGLDLAIIGSPTISGDGDSTTMTIAGALAAPANDNWASLSLVPQLQPFGNLIFVLPDASGFLIGATVVDFPPPGDVALGVNRGDGITGTRTDCLAADAVTGTSYGAGGTSISGSYPTTATSQAAQLVTDTAAVTAGKAGMTTATTILGVTGTLDMSTYVLKTNVVSAAYVVTGDNNYVGGSAGTYPTSATTAAAQLAADEAAVTAAKSGVTTATTILGVTGTLDMSLYVLKTNVVSAAYVVSGNSNYVGGAGGTYPTSTTTAAAQLATDEAAVTAAKSGVTTATTILGVTGTLDLTTYVLISDVVAADYVVTGHDNYTGGSAGTYPTTATSYAAGEAAQLVTDAAAVTAQQAGFPAETTILGVSGTMPMFTADDLEQFRYRLGIDGPAEAPATATPHIDITGPGGVAVAIVVKDTSGNLLAGINSWITSDSAGATTIAGTLESNSLGNVAFMLDAGVNYFWRKSSTYEFPNPVAITVAGPATSITLADGAVIAGPASGYAARSDIENIFGIPNIIKWAILSQNDPTGAAGLAEITARINWAIGVATADFNNAMRQGRYTLPVVGADASVWATTVVATLAGQLLYQHLKPTQRDQDGRPIPDRYDGIFTWAEQQMNFVRSGKLRLDAAVFGKGTNAPEATHERSRGAYGPGIGGYGTPALPPPGPFVT